MVKVKVNLRVCLPNGDTIATKLACSALAVALDYSTEPSHTTHLNNHSNSNKKLFCYKFRLLFDFRQKLTSGRCMKGFYTS